MQRRISAQIALLVVAMLLLCLLGCSSDYSSPYSNPYSQYQQDTFSQHCQGASSFAGTVWRLDSEYVQSLEPESGAGYGYHYVSDNSPAFMTVGYTGDSLSWYKNQDDDFSFDAAQSHTCGHITDKTYNCNKFVFAHDGFNDTTHVCFRYLEKPVLYTLSFENIADENGRWRYQRAERIYYQVTGRINYPVR